MRDTRGNAMEAAGMLVESAQRPQLQNHRAWAREKACCSKQQHAACQAARKARKCQMGKRSVATRWHRAERAAFTHTRNLSHTHTRHAGSEKARPGGTERCVGGSMFASEGCARETRTACWRKATSPKRRPAAMFCPACLPAKTTCWREMDVRGI